MPAPVLMRLDTSTGRSARGLAWSAVWTLLVFADLCVAPCSTSAAERPEVYQLWPAKPPSETQELPPEADTSQPESGLVAGRRVIRLGNVSTPQLAIYRPEQLDTGAAVVICPGGGHRILAWDLEGTEVAEWLNSLGITGIVLKYRVPFRDAEKKWLAAVQDAQRAVSLVRSRAEAWGLDRQRIGILGFSAGGEVAGRTALLDQRQYEAQDEMDQASNRPDFAVLVYPAYFVDEGQATLREDIRATTDVPPFFLVHAFDDGVTPLSSILLAAELRRVGVPAELHLYATGGHGFGLRRTDEPCTSWPDRCTDWLRRQGVLAVSSTTR